MVIQLNVYAACSLYNEQNYWKLLDSSQAELGTVPTKILCITYIMLQHLHYNNQWRERKRERQNEQSKCGKSKDHSTQIYSSSRTHKSAHPIPGQHIHLFVCVCVCVCTCSINIVTRERERDGHIESLWLLCCVSLLPLIVYWRGKTTVALDNKSLDNCSHQAIPMNCDSSSSCLSYHNENNNVYIPNGIKDLDAHQIYSTSIITLYYMLTVGSCTVCVKCVHTCAYIHVYWSDWQIVIN